MPQANGRIIGTAGTRFIATFDLPESGLQVNFLGNFASSVAPFESHCATLTYNDIADLTATRPFRGQLGPTNIKLTTSNDAVTIEGVLATPLEIGSSISGSGVWALN